MARHVIHGIVCCLATSVAKVPERWKHSIKQQRCYNKYITVFKLWSIFLFQVIRLVALLIGWPTYTHKYWKKTNNDSDSFAKAINTCPLPAQTLFKKLNSYKHWSCGTKVKIDLLLLILNFSWLFFIKICQCMVEKVQKLRWQTYQTDLPTDGRINGQNNIQIDGE